MVPVMAIKEIIQDGHEALRNGTTVVPEDLFGTAELREIIANMVNTLDAEQDGVALAAPQIAVPYRIFIVRYDRLAPTSEEMPPLPADVGVFINPEYVKVSRRREEMDEGCLSVRGIYGKTYRHERTTVRARHSDGRTFERGGGGILAQAFQHEIDHLSGVLFTDHAIEVYGVKKLSHHAGGDVVSDLNHEAP